MLSTEPDLDSSSFARRLGLFVGMPAPAIRKLLGEPAQVTHLAMAGDVCEQWQYGEEGLTLFFRGDLLCSWCSSPST